MTNAQAALMAAATIVGSRNVPGPTGQWISDTHDVALSFKWWLDQQDALTANNLIK